jgi:hypothetical protein
MKRRLFIQFLLCFFQFNSFSQAAWKIYAIDTDTIKHTITIYYIDSSYYAKDQYGNAKAWGRIEFHNPLQKGKSTLTDYLCAIDCIQKRVVELEEIRRKPVDGAVIKDIKLYPTQND